MALTERVSRPIRPRTESDVDSDDDAASNTSSAAASESMSSDDEDPDPIDSESDVDSLESEPTAEETEDLRDISFGALAKAQETLNTLPHSKKRKLSEVQEKDAAEISTWSLPQASSKDSRHPDSRPNQPLHRTSKHAPTVLSSKHPVSRKRQIFEPSAAQQSRDPRFDAAVQSRSHDPSLLEKADRDYSFLTAYQATEILNLKSVIKKTKDPDQVAKLKREVMSLEAKVRNANTKQREREIVRKHKQDESQAIREGRKSKPYFLKPSDIRKQINTERVESMGKKARDKMEKRKLKKQKGKEGRDMPRFRRSADD